MSGEGCYQLDVGAPGKLESLHLRPCAQPVAGPGQVLIRTQVTALNFKDVLNALGLYPGIPGRLGNECAGIVEAVGPDVQNVYRGDRVIAIAEGAFASVVVADARLVRRPPQGIGLEAAVTLPIAFATAYYGLQDLAQLRVGERVLIHAAAGGVGMAAVQIALRAGAIVFGTASLTKQDAVRRLGVTHVMNSRTMEFAGEVLERTDGRGVDVVLNAFTGEFISQSLSCLAQGGRFLEMGKRDLWEAERVALHKVDVSYQPFDLFDAGPRRISQILDALWTAFEAGELTPPPRRVFAHAETKAAFHYMAQARHIGKIVIDWRDHETSRASAPYLLQAVESAGPELVQRLRGVTGEQADTVVLSFLRACASRVMGCELEHADVSRPLEEYGLDSLMTGELSDQIGRAIGRSLPASLLYNYPTLDALVRFVVDLVENRAPGPAEPLTAQSLESEIEQLSEQEAAALLAIEMRQSA